MKSDVVVIGAGPVGMTLALLLARHGVRVVISEANDGPDQRSRAVTLDDESLRIWQSCGVEQAITGAWAAAEPGSVMCRYQDGRGRLIMELLAPEGDLGYQTGVVVHQPTINRILWDRVRREPGIILLKGHRVSSVDQTPAGVVTVLEDLSGQRATVSASWCVACDGANSRVRHAIGISMPTRPQKNPWLIADLEDPDPTPHAIIVCEPRRTAVTVPIPTGKRRIEVMLPPDDPCEWPDDEISLRGHLVRAWPGAAKASILQSDIVRFATGTAERWRSGRCFLAGDAAHVMPPFAGQGMASGLRDAANLSFKLGGVCRGWLHECVLDSYEAERRPHQEWLMRLTLRLGRLMSPSCPAEASAVRLSMRALRAVPMTRASLNLRGPSLRPYYRSGFVEPGGAAGRYLPQPTVRSVNGREVRLDVLLGDRMTWVVAAGGRDPSSLRTGVVQEGDTVLVEGRDFEDPVGIIRRTLGRGGTALVRPDRIIHTHFRGRTRRSIDERSAGWRPNPFAGSQLACSQPRHV
jgi:3-(3-hydroxy-phenyl)propionate hydroxylase